MTSAVGQALIIVCVFMCGMATMVLGEKFGVIPKSCIIEEGALELMKP